MIQPGYKYVLLNRKPMKLLADTASLAKVTLFGQGSSPRHLTFGKRMRCMKFYFDANGIRNLLAVSNRSGSRWTQLAIELALDLNGGGDGEYVYEDDTFYPSHGHNCSRLDWRIPSGEWASDHARASGPALGDQLYFFTHNPYFSLRVSSLRNMKAVVVTRSIPAIIASLFKKYSNSATRPGVNVKNDESFDWDEAITRTIAFYNSWGDALTWHPQIKHYKYEDMKADPIGSHCEILDFWGLNVSQDCMSEGLRRASKKEMLLHMPPAEVTKNLRISAQTQNLPKELITKARMSQIITRLNRELIFDLGYKFDVNTPYNQSFD